MPVNITPLSDETIARGVQAADFSKFDPFGSYFSGQDRAQQQAEQNLFAKGLPRVPGTNDIDWAAAGEQIARLQGIKGLQTAVGLQTEADLQRALGKLGTSSIFQPGQTSQRPEPAPISLNRTTTTAQEPAAAGSGNVPTPLNTVQSNEVPGSAQISRDGEPFKPLETTTAAKLAPRLGKDPDQLAAEWGVDVNQPLSPDEVRSKVTASPSFADRFSGGGIASAATAGVTPKPIPTVAVRPGVPQITIPGPQTVPTGPTATPAPPTPPPTQPPPLSDPIADEWERRATEAAAAGTAISMKNPAMGARLQAMSDQLFKQAHDRRQTLGGVYKSQQEGVYKQEQVLPEAAAKASVNRLEKSYEKADATAQGLNSTQDLFDQLNSKSGIFTGAWADQKLKLARISEVMGYPIAADQITPTQTFMSLMGKQVAAGVKAFGSGTSITNQDREYVQKAVGGDISLDETSIRRILTITDKLNRGIIDKHNAEVDKVIRSNPAARASLESFKVEAPPKVKGRTTQPASGPAGAMQPPPPDPSGRNVGQIYQTPKGPAYWRGNGWELAR